jgi:two-component system response regulator FixJ
VGVWPRLDELVRRDTRAIRRHQPLLDSTASAGPVHLVDDDQCVRTTLARLLRSGGYAVTEYGTEYGSGKELLASTDALNSGCTLLDVNMPGQDGLAIHLALAERSVGLPVVMMTGSGDLTILALKAGLADFKQKPFGRGELLSVFGRLSFEVCDG